ncbi:MAG: aminotransferase class I/II-fold pyridoxal phosphate-dependent enzyme [Polaribacter sp.]|uniref:threonine aldolase family protein n=1 Tax=Polaribacter sp. TaxID=1920175 RepID=UPI002F352F04
MKYSFLNDYSEGAHPKVLDALVSSNMAQQTPYGDDDYSNTAKKLIKDKIGNQNLDVFFVSGGTQANLIIISAALKSHESVISANTGHITLREAGAIEATGHKINSVISSDGKLTKEDIVEVLKEHDFGAHVVKPKMVYISNATEIGTIYTKSELTNLSDFCKKNNLYLFLDGARLGSALTASNNDISLSDIANLTDIFTIGGTKNGALIGEVIIITNDKLKEDFPFHIKQRGAMLSKGRILGIQFLELFKDDLFFDLAKHSNIMASKLSESIQANGYKMSSASTSNQIFPILPNQLITELEKNFEFYRWSKINDEFTILRLVTSWATEESKVDEFIDVININN